VVYDQALFMRTLSEFTRHLLTPHDTEQALTRMAGHVTNVLGLAGSGVSLALSDKELRFATAVPEHLVPLERIQQETRAGPCLTAYREERIVAVADLRDHTHLWPEYCAVAEKAGVSSVASVPMQLQGTRVGSLDLYGDGRRAWPDEDLAVAVVMADMATGYLINASVILRQAELNAQLQEALSSRIAIEQAKGILANGHRISVDQAFERLRRYARAHNAALHDVAEGVVSGKLEP
jgi:GAF domain-containing protein